MNYSVCGIDVGYGGGIAFHTKNGEVSAVNMPRDNKELWDYFQYLTEQHGRYVVFIERVQMWVEDSQEGNRGKQFAIGKMLANYNSLLAIIESQGIPIVEVAPITWQKELMLFFPKKDKQFRKNMYKRYAAKHYPTLKPTLKTADALCILQFGRQRCITSATWVKENLRRNRK